MAMIYYCVEMKSREATCRFNLFSRLKIYRPKYKQKKIKITEELETKKNQNQNREKEKDKAPDRQSRDAERIKNSHGRCRDKNGNTGRCHDALGSS